MGRLELYDVADEFLKADLQIPAARIAAAVDDGRGLRNFVRRSVSPTRA